MVFQNPALINGLLSKLADAIGDYIIYQIKSGAQAIMLFDSWGGQLPPAVWDAVSRPAVERMVKKARHLPSPARQQTAASGHRCCFCDDPWAAASMLKRRARSATP